MATPPASAVSAPESNGDPPASPLSLSSEGSSPPISPAPESTSPQRVPSLRAVSDPQSTPPKSASSTPLSMLQNARRPNVPSVASSGNLNPSMEARMKAFHLSRQGTPPSRPQVAGPILSTGSIPSPPQFGSPVGGKAIGGLPANLQLPGNLRPQGPHNFASAPVVPKMPAKGLSARRGMKLPGGLPGAPSPVNGGAPNGSEPPKPETAFNKFSNFVDTKTGTLKFDDRATIHGDGIEFKGGSTFKISLDEVDTLDELGKGNYGTVYKVRHARPRIRRPGLGLAGNKWSSASPITPASDKEDSIEASPTAGGTTGVVMAMKEIRLELDEAKFAAIIMELDILHKCLSPYIIDFYGAFFQEGAVYICIEFMDGGSIDKIYGDGVPESVLRKITYSTVQGLKTLKDDHNIIHRDVKPTNILCNTRGQVKICDFGVSGNLVASIAKTNIGCQSYMAPERISGGGMAQAGANPGGGTYSVQSDIWSLGLSIIEMAMGRYPYPPETYNNIFSQLSAIVDGEPPDLPSEGYSELARDFVRGCLNKIPKLRPTYSMLLQHGWLAELSKPQTITEADEEEAEAGGNAAGAASVGHSGTEDEEVAAWVRSALDRKKKGFMGEPAKPALHAAPLDSVSPAQSPA